MTVCFTEAQPACAQNDQAAEPQDRKSCVRPVQQNRYGEKLQMELKGKKVLVFGCGKSGIAAANLLCLFDADVLLFDGNIKLDENVIRGHLTDPDNITIKFGKLGRETIGSLDLAVLSPGVPADAPLVEEMRRAGVSVWGEVELAYRCGRGDVLAVTGTNGKTTTTSLLGEIMAAACGDVRVVGNIGIPYTSMIAGATDRTVTVAEISSFQLETIDEFCPKISAILNITPDHLNRHHTMENYIRAKLAITKNQTRKEVCVLNYEDEVLRNFGESAEVSVLWFSSARELENGLYLKEGAIWYARANYIRKVICVSELNLLGTHNYENVMAACAMAISYGVELETIRTVLRAFRAVEHRIEYVTEKRGIRFYNDSKGTNPDAAIKGILAMDRPTFLIGGGYDKQSSYDEWIASFGGKVKKLVLLGETREKIAGEAKRQGFLDYVFVDSLEEAVAYCYANAEEGDAVLLSPACASWDMFPNYEVRGKRFKELALGLD